MLNRIILMGRLTRDPETRYTQGADPIPVASFGLAVDRDFKRKDGQKETDFFDITAWRQRADFVTKYFKKGQLVCVEGRLEREDWKDKDGGKRISYKIVVDNCYFAEGKKAEDNGSRSSSPEESDTSIPEGFDPFNGDTELSDDDLPF